MCRSTERFRRVMMWLTVGQQFMIIIIFLLNHSLSILLFLFLKSTDNITVTHDANVAISLVRNKLCEYFFEISDWNDFVISCIDNWFKCLTDNLRMRYELLLFRSRSGQVERYCFGTGMGSRDPVPIQTVPEQSLPVRYAPDVDRVNVSLSRLINYLKITSHLLTWIQISSCRYLYRYRVINTNNAEN